MITTLVDASVLVYAAGVNADGARQHVALAALRDVRPVGALSVQVLSESSSVLLRSGRAIDQILHDVDVLASSWQVVCPADATLSRALAGVHDHRLIFWDAMIWATVLHHGMTVILSEDEPTGHPIEGIQYESPF